MPTQLYGGLPEDKFRTMAKTAVREYWNANDKLRKQFGQIDNRKVFVVWQVKAIQNNKALLAVNVDGDGLYFEYTYNGDAKEAYLDVYKKQDKKTLQY